MTPLRPGDPRTLGPYRLVGLLGAGGMGRVYLGESPAGRRVAIKVVRPEFADDPALRKRFKREVDAGRKVSALYTAPVVDSDADADPPWFATTYVEGPSLDHLIRAHGPMTHEATLTLGAGLAEALVAIHKAGLVHRDVKPSNVLLTEDGPCVIDFGIARLDDATALTSGAIGTPAYMSPEHLQPSGAVAASDVFCLAATIAFAAAGEGPLGAGSQQSLLMRLATGQWDLGRVPPAVRTLLEPCLNSLAAARPKPGTLLRSFLAAGAKPPSPGWYESGGTRHPYGQPSRGTAPTPDPAAWPTAGGDVTTAARRTEMDERRASRPAIEGQRNTVSRRSLFVGAGVAAAATIGVGVPLWLNDRAPVDSATTRPTGTKTSAPPTTPPTTPAIPFGTALGKPIGGHTALLWTVATAVLNGQSVIVSGGEDRTIRVWDLATGAAVGKAITGHTDKVMSLTTTVDNGRDVIVSSSQDRTIRIWDAETRVQRGTALTGHTSYVIHVTTAVVNGETVIVSSGGDESTRVWSLPRRTAIGSPRRWGGAVYSTGTTIAAGEKAVAATGHQDDRLGMWDIATGELLTPAIRTGARHAYFAEPTMIGAEHLIVALGANDTVRTWDPVTGNAHGTSLAGAGRVVAMTTATVAGRPLLATANTVGEARIWDLSTKQAIGPTFGKVGPAIDDIAIGTVGADAVLVVAYRDLKIRRYSISPPPAR